jgi:hypothetical protein
MPEDVRVSGLLFIIIIIIIIMALQPFVGPWTLFQFLDPIHSRQDSLDGDQPVARPLYLHTEHKHTSDIQALSGIRTHDPSVRASEDTSCLRPRGHCDRPGVDI